MPFATHLLRILKQDVLLIIPQLFLAIVATIMVWPGDLFVSKQQKKIWATIASLALLITIFLIHRTPIDVGFSNMLETSPTIKKFQYLIVATSIITIILSNLQLRLLSKQTAEYYALILFSTVGMLFLTEAIDLIVIYFSIELMAMSIYILTAYLNNKERSIEAGIKYFLLGAFSSSIFLFGVSLLFIASNGTTTNLIALNKLFITTLPDKNIIIIIGTLMILIGICFKIAAAPFHMWSPDIYDGAMTSITSFISVAPKIAALVAFLHIFNKGLTSTSQYWISSIIYISILSMILGNIAALKQQTMKRLLAYSGIAHIGYILLGTINTDTISCTQSLWLYVMVYMIMQSSIFTIIIFLQDKHIGERIDNVRGLSKTHPLLAFILMITVISFAGIPPSLGFFSKFYIFKFAIAQNHQIITTIALITSAIATYYYLSIIALMYFDEPITINNKYIDITTKILSGTSCVIILMGIALSRYITEIINKIA